MKEKLSVLPVLKFHSYIGPVEFFDGTASRRTCNKRVRSICFSAKAASTDASQCTMTIERCMALPAESRHERIHRGSAGHFNPAS
jgi:hypothetical protein